MAINDPLFKQGIRTWDRAVVALRVLQTSILLIIMAAVVFAALAVATPLALFANTTAPPIDTAPPQIGETKSVPIIQATTCAQDLSFLASRPLTSEEIALLRNADPIEPETNQPPAEAWLKKFQAWAAEEDTRAQIQPVGSPVPGVGAQVLQNARAEVRPVRVNQHIRSDDKATRVRSAHKTRANFRRAHKARLFVRLANKAGVRVRRQENFSAPEWFAHDVAARWSKRSLAWVY